MSNNTFEYVGYFTIGKESEKFKPYDNTDYPSGWTNRDLKFNQICGSNRHMLEIKGGCFKDGHGKVYSFSKATVDDKGNKEKGKSLEFAWNDRFKPENIEQVAEFKKFVIDLEKPNVRYNLEKIIEKFKDNTVTDEDIKNTGCSTIEEAEKALEESKKKRHEFLTEYDFAEFVHKLITSGKVDKVKFKVTGNIDIQYSEKKGEFYEHLYPTRIYLADQNAEPISDGVVTLYFNKDGFDENSVKDKGKYFVNAYIRNYDSSIKTDIPCPLLVSIPVTGDEKVVGLAEILKKQFTVGKKDKDMWKELGVKIHMLDGAQKVELTEDMLSENERELLLLGEITEDDIIKDRGGSVYGDKVIDNEVYGFARGYLKGAKPTVFTDNDFAIANSYKGEEDTKTSNNVSTETNNEKTESESTDIFDIDIDI